MPESSTNVVTQMERVEIAVDKLERAMNPPLITRFLFGIVNGFGTIVGATLVVAILLWVVQPLKQLQGIGPAFERLTEALERKPNR